MTVWILEECYQEDTKILGVFAAFKLVEAYVAKHYPEFVREPDYSTHTRCAGGPWWGTPGDRSTHYLDLADPVQATEHEVQACS